MTRILMKSPRLSVLKQKSEEHDIFISYRREPDQDVANSIRCKLENNRYKETIKIFPLYNYDLIALRLKYGIDYWPMRPLVPFPHAVQRTTLKIS